MDGPLPSNEGSIRIREEIQSNETTPYCRPYDTYFYITLITHVLSFAIALMSRYCGLTISLNFSLFPFRHYRVYDY